MIRGIQALAIVAKGVSGSRAKRKTAVKASHGVTALRRQGTRFPVISGTEISAADSDVDHAVQVQVADEPAPEITAVPAIGGSLIDQEILRRCERDRLPPPSWLK